MNTPVDCLVEASAALTRYRALTKGQRPPIDDLTLYEWLTSFAPERRKQGMQFHSTPEQVMREVLTDNVYLWDPRLSATQWALDGEVERVCELLDNMGYLYQSEAS